MRLLRYSDGAHPRISMIQRIHNIPPYAIVSSTWGADDEVVTFRDVLEDKGKDKTGYRKLQICAEQAAKDGLEYLWIDSCCIDNSSSAELTEAINSMFHWYRGASKCYVYLWDVRADTPIDYSTIRQQFKISRWFTRAWTIQDLVAPRTVEFFSADGQMLGDKISLAQEISSTTGISVEVLEGKPLTSLSVDERMSWVQNRHATREEDLAYSMLGVFGVYMTVLYGEGRDRAFARLHRKIQRQNDYISRQSSEEGGTSALGSQESNVVNLNMQVSASSDSDDGYGSETGSIFSDGGSSTSSATTATLNPVQTTGIREVAQALLSNEEFKALYTTAVLHDERREARPRIRRFLKTYGRNLLKEASSDSLRIQAAKFVQKLAGRITDEITWNISGQTTNSLTRRSSPKKQNLEDWLSSLQGGGGMDTIEQPHEPGDRADDDDMYEQNESNEELNDELSFPNIDRVKEFLLTSLAFQEHLTAVGTWMGIDRRLDVYAFSEETHLRNVVADNPPAEKVSEPQEEEFGQHEVQQKATHQNDIQRETTSEQESQHDAIHEQKTQKNTTNEQEPDIRARRHRSGLALVSGLLNFWGISFFFFDLVELFMPRVPEGYRRLRWRCSCDTVLWGDFPISDEAAFDEFRRQVLCLDGRYNQKWPASGTTRSQAVDDSGSGTHAAVPLQQLAPAATTPELSGSLPAASGVACNLKLKDAMSPTADHVVNIAFPLEYFEVCVSTGNHAIDHHEIDISRVTSDSELFELIWDKYNKSRGIGLRRIFLRPSNVDFVMFSVNRRNQYGAGIHMRPDEFPPQEELDNMRYHYLCPKIRMPANVFLHYLHRARWNIWGEHSENTWLRRLPKKLSESLCIDALKVTQPGQQDPLSDPDLAFGWGIHIIDGPNHAVLGMLLAAGVAVAFIVSGMVVGFAKTQEQGFGIGNFLLAIIASIMAAIYFQLQDP